ncbi:hypothetical protein [Cellulomonas sp. Root137]|uniref:hypothetical protein n=1 Tax=Cellulomonas sp. Root137 TaxID=1736459 RepID=UPI0006F24307|nr:hypothetical protein [Cellulomonas sp. Root137]KQY46490.1 hypothetical protein ASD18_03370 [Cellulomonas sp. Root137]KRD43639.1 hypothetical protein ASE38_05325 [Cellulomonas sp. Root930]
MKLFARRGAVPADVGDGFVAGEAVALQTAFAGALIPAERAAQAPVRVDLTLETEGGGRVVVVCRNHVVGFVPPSREESARAQLAAAGRARLETSGQVFRDAEGWWRLWVGPPRTGAFPAPEPGADTLGEARRKIFGIALPDDQG